MKTIPLEYSFIRGRLEGKIGRKPLGILNSATRNIISAPKMESDDDNLNIKVVPLGDVKLFMLKTLSFEAISFSFTPCQNLMSTHAPLFFGKACTPKNNMLGICSKDDVNTPLAIYFLRAIIMYRPCLC